MQLSSHPSVPNCFSHKRINGAGLRPKDSSIWADLLADINLMPMAMKAGMQCAASGALQWLLTLQGACTVIYLSAPDTILMWASLLPTAGFTAPPA